MRKTVAAVSIVGVVLASVVAFNWFSVTGAAREVGGRPSNDMVDVWAYHRLGVVPGEIVYDVRGVQPNASAADVTRTLLQFAAEVRDAEFDKVFLAWRGEQRFMLDGAYFRTLGREYGSQNPVYTLRTLPENVMTKDGKPAFSEWSGGMIGVLAGQMGDLNEFHRRWFVDDALRDLR